MNILKIALVSWLTSCVPTLAQSPDVQGSSSQGEHPRKRSGGNETTLVGCLLGHDGNYVLMTQNQSSSVKLGSTEDLKTHVGHKVKIVGRIGNASESQNAASSSTGSGNDKNLAQVSFSSEVSTLTVTKVKTLSKTCDKLSKKPEKSWTEILTP
jgi:hypothetical protein